MSAGVAKFALDNLAIFERHGAKASRTRGKRAGCHVKFRNGWTLSVQWNYGNYGSNYDFVSDDPNALVPDATTAEIAAWPEGGGMVTWADGDTVQGWCSMERVQHVADLIARGVLVKGGVATNERES